MMNQLLFLNYQNTIFNSEKSYLVFKIILYLIQYAICSIRKILKHDNFTYYKS